MTKTWKRWGFHPDDPSGVEFYCSDFEGKDKIVDFIKQYNSGVDEEKSITYTDYVGLMMSSVTTIINAISYILIAFVAISLVVSSIMIGIITYISVLERTKEIGILRSIGASKGHFKSVQRRNRYCRLCGGYNRNTCDAAFEHSHKHYCRAPDRHRGNFGAAAGGGAILVIISVVLTLIAGLIPSSVAAKKTPVEALRSE